MKITDPVLVSQIVNVEAELVERSDYILGQFAGVSSETLRRSRFLCNEAPDDIQDALFAGVIAIGTAYKKLQAEKKREQAKEARRLAREAEKPNHSPQEKTLENPEGIVGGEPVYHNGELMRCRGLTSTPFMEAATNNTVSLFRTAVCRYCGG